MMVLKSLCLLTWWLLSLKISMLTSIKLRKGETGRYVYGNGSGDAMYCYYCPDNLKIFASEDANKKYLVKLCINNNYPYDQKLDQVELNNKQYPVCNTGTIPSCPRPKDPVHGLWICEALKDLDYQDKVPVYKTCMINCNPGYKALGEESIFCNESRKWDPTGETACIKASACPELNDPEHGQWNCNITTDGSIQYNSCHVQCDDNYVLEGGEIILCNNTDKKWTRSDSKMACALKKRSEVVSCLAVTVSVAVGVPICILVIIICYRKKCRQGLDYTFSRMETGIEQSLIFGKGDSVNKSTTKTFKKLENTAVKQDSKEYTSLGDTNANADVDNSSIEPLLQTKTMGDNLSSPGRDAIEHDDQPSDACMAADSASKDKLNAIEDTDTRCDADRLGPEGQSLSTSEVNIQPVLPPEKLKKDSEETFSKEFERDPSSCNKKVYEDLLRELETRSEKWLCERIVEYFEEMEEQNMYHGLNQDDQRNQAYALMRKKDIRIGHIVYHISGVQSHNKKTVLQQIRKIHPNCNFCKSLYGNI